MERLFAHLYDIRKKPALYLTDKSLRLLRAYIDGYISGQDDTNHNGRSMRDFQRFIEKKFSSSRPQGQGWCMIIAYHSISESYAFDRFFELLDEFLQERGNEQDKQETQ